MESNYFGTSKIETTNKNNTEILKLRGEKWSFDYKFKHFYFDNKNDCTVKINGGSPIFLEAGDSWQTDITNTPIESFVIVESGISYKWSGDLA